MKTRPILPIAPGLDRRRVFRLRERIDGGCRVVPRAPDDLDQRCFRRSIAIEFDVRGLVREIDGCPDTGRAVQHLFDPGRACGARHPGEVEIEGLRCRHRGGTLERRMVDILRRFLHRARAPSARSAAMGAQKLMRPVSMSRYMTQSPSRL